VGFVYSWSRFTGIFSGFLVAFFLKKHGRFGVFVFIGGALLLVSVVIALFGPRTNQLALEEIAR